MSYSELQTIRHAEFYLYRPSSAVWWCICTLNYRCWLSIAICKCFVLYVSDLTRYLANFHSSPLLVYSLQERGNSYELDSHASDRPFRAFTRSFLAMRALFRHASFTRICDCRIFRIFQQSAHISYLFRINWLFRRQFDNFYFCVPLHIGVVTSTVWLPTEWHHHDCSDPCGTR